MPKLSELLNYDAFFRMHGRLNIDGSDVPVFCDQELLLTHEVCKSIISDLGKYMSNVSEDRIKSENQRRLDELNNRTSYHGSVPSPSLSVKKPGHVYLFKLNSLYKIGLSKNYKDRLNGMRTVAPKIKYVHHHDTSDCIGLERKFHEQYKEKRKHGEWFKLLPSDVDYFKKWKES